MNKILVTIFPLRPLGFCKCRVSNYVLGIGLCDYAGDFEYEVDIRV